jgi:hypothetical protein
MKYDWNDKDESAIAVRIGLSRVDKYEGLIELNLQHSEECVGIEWKVSDNGIEILLGKIGANDEFEYPEEDNVYILQNKTDLKFALRHMQNRYSELLSRRGAQTIMMLFEREMEDKICNEKGGINTSRIKSILRHAYLEDGQEPSEGGYCFE